MKRLRIALPALVLDRLITELRFNNKRVVDRCFFCMVLVVFVELRLTEARFLVGELTIFHRGICVPFVIRISFRQFSFECGLRNARAFEVGFLSRARPYAAVYFEGAFVVSFMATRT